MEWAPVLMKKQQIIGVFDLTQNVESVKIIRVKIILHLAMTIIGSVALAALEVKTFDWHTTSMAVC